MGVPTWEVDYNSALPRREDHEVRKGHVGHWIKKKKLILSIFWEQTNSYFVFNIRQMWMYSVLLQTRNFMNLYFSWKAPPRISRILTSWLVIRLKRDSKECVFQKKKKNLLTSAWLTEKPERFYSPEMNQKRSRQRHRAVDTVAEVAAASSCESSCCGNSDLC